MNAQLEAHTPRTALGDPDNDSGNFGGVRKAAMLLISLGDQASAKIISQLSEDEIQRVSKEVAGLRSLSADKLESVLEEFSHLTMASDYVVSGGFEYARKMLVTAFGQDGGQRLLDRLPLSSARNRPRSARCKRPSPSNWRGFCSMSIPKPSR